MSRCQQCGQAFGNPFPKFCNECGHDNSWAESELNNADHIKKYILALHQIFFDIEMNREKVEQYSFSLRQRFKISFERHETVLNTFEVKKRSLTSMQTLQLEFDENVTDAYAGEDTYLRFRITSPIGGSEIFKVTLEWDDPETPDEMDYIASSAGLIKPGQQVELGGTHVFNRAGPKEISDLLMTIENQFFEKEVFKVSPFRFNVAKASEHVVNYISTHNQISIEGRGVVDASGSGREPQPDSTKALQPRWNKLNFSLTLDDSFLDKLVHTEIYKIERPLLPRTDDRQIAEIKQASHFPIIRLPDLSFAPADLFHQLEELGRHVPDSEKGKIISSAHLGLAYLEQLAIRIQEKGPEEIFGLVVTDTSTVQYDSDAFVLNVPQDFLLICSAGLAVFNSDGSALLYQWAQLAMHNIQFYAQKFGARGFLLFLGNINEKSYFPGCRFDLRRYQGDENQDDFVAKLQSILNEICLDAPLTETASLKTTFEVRVPNLGEFKEPSVSKIHVNVGERVTTNLNLLDIETDKVVIEIPAPQEGKILSLLVKQGDLVSEGAPLVILESEYTIGSLSKQHHVEANPNAQPDVNQTSKIQHWDEYAPPTYSKHGISSTRVNDGGASFLSKNDVTEPEKLTFENGDVYFGQVVNGEMHGKGVYTFSPQCDWAGQRYEGDFWANQFHGLATLYNSNGEHEACVYRENKKLGLQERYEYPNGDHYIGTMQDGQPHGFGKYKWAGRKDCEFIGSIKKGLIHGIGRYFFYDEQGHLNSEWPPDVFYQGKYAGNQESYHFDNGDQYLGTLKTDVPHGYGEYRFSGEFAGHVIFGSFRQGFMHGLMDSFYPDGSFKETVYLEGAFIGEQQTLTYENGDRYTGILENGLPEKFGYKLFDSGNLEYLGEFAGGKFQGEGVYICAGEIKTYGYWYQGALTQTKTEALIRQHATKIIHEKFYLIDQVPPKKLANVRGSYLKDLGLLEGEQIILIYDDTLFGTAKDGTTFTSKGIYCHDTGGSGWHLPYAELGTIVQKKKNLIINGKHIIKIIMAEQQDSNVIRDMLLAIQHHYEMDFDRLIPLPF